MPPDAWSGTSLGTAKQLVSALPAAPRSRALRDLQFKVMVSELNPPPADGSPPPSLFARKVNRLAAMGEAESLNEMVRSAGALFFAGHHQRIDDRCGDHRIGIAARRPHHLV